MDFLAIIEHRSQLSYINFFQIESLKQHQNLKEVQK